MDFGLFEQYPLLLVAFIIVTVEVWNLIKSFAIRAYENSHKRPTM